MITKNMDVHLCSHCNKLYQRKHACLKHEPHCKKNPANQHKCFEFCANLERLRLIDGDEYSAVEYTQFRCSVTGNDMWSYIAERRGISCDGVRMPLECEHYDGMRHCLGLG